ncbi:MAG: ribonuclease HII [Gammaproteobacteria bacterium]|nr:ribonuclease HII [Gammaproteobacteria bacterium]
MQSALFAPAEGPVAGVDEAGRGPLAGPVVAGAVILDPDREIDGLTDSKALSERQREVLAVSIMRHSIAWSVAWADTHEIDRLNILQATYLAMRRAILGLRLMPGRVEVDGNRLPNLMFGNRHVEGNAVIGGDRLVPSISAASIIAKVHRDGMMRSLDSVYPDYGFSRHKGYGTEAHRDALSRLGPCPQHRRTFRPISSL